MFLKMVALCLKRSRSCKKVVYPNTLHNITYHEAGYTYIPEDQSEKAACKASNESNLVPD